MQKKCRFGTRCWNINTCRFYHSPMKTPNPPTKCRYGPRCFNKQACKFYHPPEQIQKRPYQKTYKPREDKEESQKKWIEKGSKGEKEQNDVKKSSFSNEMTFEETLVKEQEENKSDKQIEFFEIYKAQQEYLEHKLEDFFNPRLLKNMKFDKIYDYIIENSDPNDVQLIFQRIQHLEEQRPQIVSNFGYLKVVKTIIKKDFEYNRIVEQLLKQLDIRHKKQQKETQLLETFSQMIPYSVLTDADLIELPPTEFLFIVDGNNVLPTQKIFRKYFYNSDEKIKAQGQIRLKWLTSELPNCILFFDQKYNSEYYNQIKERIFYQQEKSDIDQQKCIFAQKEKQEKADDVILECIKGNRDRKNVLITGDKALIQYGLRIQDSGLLVSSGLFFIKFCKEFIRRKYFGDKIKKRVIKRIFVEPPEAQEDDCDSNQNET